MKACVCVYYNTGPGVYYRQELRYSVDTPYRNGEKIKQHEFDPRANSTDRPPPLPAGVICLRYVSAESVNGNGGFPWKRSPAAPAPSFSPEWPALNVLASMKSYVTSGEAAPLLAPDKPIRSGASNYHICQVVHQRVAGDLRRLMPTLGLIVWE